MVFHPVVQGTTRVAALLAGEVDLAYPLPLQDLERVRRAPGLEVLVAPEVRTVFFGMDQARDELRQSDVKGANPLRDRRVRLAIYQAIDAEAIRVKIMRGAATPTASLVGPGITGFPADLQRYPYDPVAARALLAEAGYPNGFALGLDCPNDRYVNDAAICQAVAAMLAVAFVPLYQQHMAWGLRDTLEVMQRPDDQLVWRFVRRH